MKFKLIILIAPFIISGCTPQSLLANLSSEAAKSDIESAIRKCPQVKERMTQCLGVTSTIADVITGRCVRPMTVRSIEYMTQDCLEEQGGSPVSKQSQMLHEIK